METRLPWVEAMSDGVGVGEIGGEIAVTIGDIDGCVVDSAFESVSTKISITLSNSCF